MADSGPNQAESGSCLVELAYVGRMLAELATNLDESGQNVVGSGAVLACIARIRAKCALVVIGPNLVEIRPHLVDVGPRLVDAHKMMVEFGSNATHRRPIDRPPAVTPLSSRSLGARSHMRLYLNCRSSWWR